MIVWGLLIFILIYFIMKAVSSPKMKPEYSNMDRQDSMEILKIRFAKGDINKEEFLKMKDSLTKL